MADYSLSLSRDVGGCGLSKVIPSRLVHSFGVQVYSDGKQKQQNLPVGRGEVAVKNVANAVAAGDFTFLKISEKMKMEIQDNATACFA